MEVKSWEQEGWGIQGRCKGGFMKFHNPEGEQIECTVEETESKPTPVWAICLICFVTGLVFALVNVAIYA